MEDDRNKPGSDSRRAFLKGAGATGVEAGEPVTHHAPSSAAGIGRAGMACWQKGQCDGRSPGMGMWQPGQRTSWERPAMVPLSIPIFLRAWA